MICVTPRAVLIGNADAEKVGQRYRQRLDVALGDVELDHGECRARQDRERAGGHACSEREDAAAAWQTRQAGRTTLGHCDPGFCCENCFIR
jgi:hypothetical protein